MRIVIVEDNLDSAEMLAEYLRIRGHEVALAEDGHAAQRLVESFAPSVALLDIALPDTDGYTLAPRLRARAPGLCLIALTGYARDSDRARANAAGFEAHFVKPLDLRRLVELLEARAAYPLAASRDARGGGGGAA